MEFVNSRRNPLAGSPESAWIAACGSDEGPVFRAIDRWGRVGDSPMHIDSLAPLLRSIFRRAGVDQPEAFSTHSLRRGFANWAASNGWDVRNLMEYVGWKDVKTALRYLDASPAAARQRIERGLSELPELPPPERLHQTAATPLELTLRLRSLTGSTSREAMTRRRIEQWCLAALSPRRDAADGDRYQLLVSADEEATLDERVHTLLVDMHRIAENGECRLEASLRDTETGRFWN